MDILDELLGPAPPGSSMDSRLFSEVLRPAAHRIARHARFPGDSPRAGRETLQKWFLDRALATSRYVLFIEQRESGRSYRDWCKLFGSDNTTRDSWLHIADVYPGLIRQIGHLYCDLPVVMTEMSDRLAEDRPEIAARFLIREDDPVVDLETGLSDPHRCGRTVMRLRFASGASLIYKPKPITVEAIVNNWLTMHGSEFGLKSLKVMDRESYGWVEDVGPPLKLSDPRASGEEMGRAAAFFWLLNATDLHLENVRPAANGIACLDLETLLCAPVLGSVEDGGSWRRHSISSTLLFDASVFAHGRAGNISGFYPAPWTGPFAPDVEFALEGDVVTMVRRPARAPMAVDSRMVSATADVRLMEEMAAGFRSASCRMARLRLESFVDDIPEGVALRFVLRETFFYGRIKERMRQPRFLRDEAAIRCDLSLLHDGVTVGGAGAKFLQRVVDDEMRQLERGDIPYFMYRAGDRTLQLSDGTQIPFFDVEPKQFAREKLHSICESDIEEQLALMQIAIGLGPRKTAPSGNHSADEGFKADLAWLCHSLCASAFRPDNGPSRWLSLHGDVSQKDVSVSVGDTALFGGSIGIVLGIQAAETVLQDVGAARFLDEEARRWRENADWRKTGFCLGFSGLGGDLFGMAELMRLAPERWSFLWVAAEARITAAGDILHEDKLIDVVGGRAGLIIALQRILAAQPPDELGKSARALLLTAAQTLVVCAERGPAGTVWRVPIEDRPLLGYAHGWAGMVTALAGALQYSGEGAVRTQIENCLVEALRFVEHDFTRHSAFVEHRSGEGVGDPLNGSWCNGVPGFLRGILAAQPRRSPVLRPVVNDLIRQIEAGLGKGEAIRFCCGELGAVDFLLDLARSASDEVREEVARAAGRNAIARGRADAQGPDINLRPEIAFPGLFQNLSGLLYTGCRLEDTRLVSLSGQATAQIDAS